VLELNEENCANNLKQQEEELVELNHNNNINNHHEQNSNKTNNQVEIMVAVENGDLHTSGVDRKSSTKSRSRHNRAKNYLSNRIQNLFKRFFRFLICTKRGKILGGLVWLCYMTLAIWSASHIREGINLSDLVAEDSYYSAYTNDNAKLTDLNPIVMFVIHAPIDYDNVHVRMKLKNLLADAFKIDGINNGFNLNWLSSFGNQKIRYKKNLTNLFDKLKDFPPYLNDLIIEKCELRGGSTGDELFANKTEKCTTFKYDPSQFEESLGGEKSPQKPQNEYA
jgi:hypothetical protein